MMMKVFARVVAVLVLAGSSHTALLAQDAPPPPDKVLTPTTPPTTPPTIPPSEPPTTGTPDPVAPPEKDDEAKAKRRAHVTIKVLAQGKTPLEDATVTVQRGNKESELTTDDSGRCGISVRRETDFTITVSAPGFDTVKFSRNLAKGADWAIARVHLFKKQVSDSLVAEWRVGRTGELENPERDFAKFVFDVNYYKDHSPIDNAKVILTREDGKVARRLSTDEDGRVETLIREGRKFDVKIRAAGYADYNTRLAPGNKATSRRVVVNLRKKI